VEGTGTPPSTRNTQTHGHLADVDLGFHGRTVRLRHEHLDRAVTGLGPDFGFADRDTGADHLIGHVDHGDVGGAQCFR